MAFTVDKLQRGHKDIRIIIGGQPLNLTIDPSYLTQAVMDEYRDASQDSDYETMAYVFGNIVREWDLLESEDGDPLPINGDTLQSLPLMVLNRIWDEIANAVAPKSRKKNAN